MTGSWLCREDADRERLVEMEQHLSPVRGATMAMLAAVIVASVGFVRTDVAVPAVATLILAVSLFAVAERRIGRSRRPEFVIFAAWIGAQVAVAVCIAVSGGPTSPLLPVIAIPVVTLSARFSLRGVIVGLVATLALLVAATVAVDPAAVAERPSRLLASAAAVTAIGILSTALMRSDRHYRDAAVVDQLTGMLNRKALVNRAQELAQQSKITGQPVGMVIGDLDRFKAVNDSLGHAAGDAVLTDVAYLMRKRLRAFDLAYRIGGEEFLLLLPGAGLAESRAYAEELRRAVELEPVGDGVEMTMSFGVSASPSGHQFDYRSVFAAADAGLYEAKRSGRNRVCIEESPADDTPRLRPAPTELEPAA